MVKNRSKYRKILNFQQENMLEKNCTKNNPGLSNL